MSVYSEKANTPVEVSGVLQALSQPYRDDLSFGLIWPPRQVECMPVGLRDVPVEGPCLTGPGGRQISGTGLGMNSLVGDRDCIICESCIALAVAKVAGARGR
jgi:hypothetical protein